MQMIRAGFIVLVAIAPCAVAATVKPFDDLIDHWGPCGAFDAAWVGQGAPLRYTHDIRDSVDFEAGCFVKEATLRLDFTNDLSDDHGRFFIVP